MAIRIFNYLKEYDDASNEEILYYKTYAYVETFYKTNPTTEKDIVFENFYKLLPYWDKLLRHIRSDREVIECVYDEKTLIRIRDNFWRHLDKDYTKDKFFKAYLVDYFSIYREMDKYEHTLGHFPKKDELSTYTYSAKKKISINSMPY